MLTPWARVSRPKDPTTDPSRIAQGLRAIALRCACTHLLAKDWVEPEHAFCLYTSSRARLSPRLPIDGRPSPILGSRLKRRPRPMLEASALSAQGLGAPRCRIVGAMLSTTPPIGSRTRHDTRGQKPSAGFKGLRAPRPACQPLKPDTFATKEDSRRCT
jgi:hypothetical protein